MSVRKGEMGGWWHLKTVGSVCVCDDPTGRDTLRSYRRSYEPRPARIRARHVRAAFTIEGRVMALRKHEPLATTHE